MDREVRIAARRRADQMVTITALDVPGGQTDVFSLDDIEHHPDYRWANYVRGVAYYLRQANVPLIGVDAVISSSLPAARSRPRGCVITLMRAISLMVATSFRSQAKSVSSPAGLSSSAALEVCTATILQSFGNARLDGVTVARLCQRAETDFVGVKTGIMDQYASVFGEAGKALKVDCRLLTYEPVGLPRGVTVVVADTNKKRHLAGSDYNTRYMECQNAVTLLSQLLDKEIRALRDVSPTDLKRVGESLPENLQKRARHVITENARVEKAARAAKRNDAVTFGALMNESQTSLCDDYEASSLELDLMVEIARRQHGCFGSRLTGAGWGGATVNLVRDANVALFVENVARAYQRQTGIEPWVSPVRASRGAGLLDEMIEPHVTLSDINRGLAEHHQGETTR
jgi:galactokinase